MNAYTPGARSRLRRLYERGSYDVDAINAVLDAGLIAHVGYVIDGQPFVTPTAYWREAEHVYWHGSSASRMLRTVREGVPVCLTVTHLDGLVLARSGFHHSMNYRSVMLFGRAEIVEDPSAKERALDVFIDRLCPGRRAELRPPTPQELKATMVVRMTIEEGSAKVRTGPPKDDEEDYALSVWAGVVPVRQVVGSAVPDPRLPEATPVPEHVRSLVGSETFDAALAEVAAG